MHGLGNDFVLLDLRRQGFQLDAETARRLAERNTGVGCDQVLVLKHPAEDGQLASFEVWNADGSRAEQCGNGVRCLGLYLKMCDEAPAGPFALGGPVGEVIVECQGDGLVQVDMGRPVFEPSAIPLDLEPVDGWYTLDTTQGQVRIGAASMGNPHALLLVDDVETADVASLGSAVSTHPAFPQGCNAGFAQVLDRGHIRLRVYERGAGETRACGSGACAAVAVLHRAGMVENTVQVTQKGGNLLISWPGGKKKVIMTGDATHVFRGKLA
jgi:diaminopimelate epimerase